MFWQAFICGIGGALGACIVVLTFVAIFVRTKKSEREEILENNKLSLRALVERNTLSANQAEILLRIAQAIEARNV